MAQTRPPFHPGVVSTYDMRVTLVTETYFPQVNGVSRTLRELVRVLTECGDEVQLIYPDYGEAVDREKVHTVRSIVSAVLQRATSPSTAVWRGPSGDPVISA